MPSWKKKALELTLKKVTIFFKDSLLGFQYFMNLLQLYKI